MILQRREPAWSEAMRHAAEDTLVSKVGRQPARTQWHNPVCLTSLQNQNGG